MLEEISFCTQAMLQAFEPPATAPSDWFARRAAGRDVQSRQVAYEASSVALVSTLRVTHWLLRSTGFNTYEQRSWHRNSSDRRCSRSD